MFRAKFVAIFQVVNIMVFMPVMGKFFSCQLVSLFLVPFFVPKMASMYTRSPVLSYNASCPIWLNFDRLMDRTWVSTLVKSEQTVKCTVCGVLMLVSRCPFSTDWFPAFIHFSLFFFFSFPFCSLPRDRSNVLFSNVFPSLYILVCVCDCVLVQFSTNSNVHLFISSTVQQTTGFTFQLFSSIVVLVSSR